MINSSTTVSAELALGLLDPDHGSVPVVASLYYSADDPYAIRVVFEVGADEPVEWIFARDLLAVGMEGPAGQGDVQVWPADSDGHEVLNVALSSPFGEARFEMPRSSTAAFLCRTYEVIAPGRETDYVDVDSALDELLWRA
jgi:hypothetical protein